MKYEKVNSLSGMIVRARAYLGLQDISQERIKDALLGDGSEEPLRGSSSKGGYYTYPPCHLVLYTGWPERPAYRALVSGGLHALDPAYVSRSCTLRDYESVAEYVSAVIDFPAHLRVPDHLEHTWEALRGVRSARDSLLLRLPKAEQDEHLLGLLRQVEQMLLDA